MKHIIYTIILSSAMLLTFIGCEGPAGAQGDQGLKGDAGEQGLQGEQGSANVQTVQLIWNSNDIQESDDSTFGYVIFEVEQLTQEIADDGAVMAFYNESLGSLENWIAMPVTRGFDDNSDGEIDQVIEFTYAYDSGLVVLYFINTKGDNVVDSDFLEGRVKLTLIPPSSKSKMKGEDFNNRVKQKGLRTK